MVNMADYFEEANTRGRRMNYEKKGNFHFNYSALRYDSSLYLGCGQIPIKKGGQHSIGS